MHGSKKKAGASDGRTWACSSSWPQQVSSAERAQCAPKTALAAWWCWLRSPGSAAARAASLCSSAAKAARNTSVDPHVRAAPRGAVKSGACASMPTLRWMVQRYGSFARQLMPYKSWQLIRQHNTMMRRRVRPQAQSVTLSAPYGYFIGAACVSGVVSPAECHSTATRTADNRGKCCLQHNKE